MSAVGILAHASQQAPNALTEAVLREIAGLLGALLRDAGYEGAIDLRSLPMSEADRVELKTFLGQGEIDATCDAAGESSVMETSFAGVWWVVHRAADGTPLVEQIVVARAPRLLFAHPADIAAAHEDLVIRLKNSVPAAGGANRS